MFSHDLYNELHDARFAYEALRGDPNRIEELGRASHRLLRARQAVHSRRVMSRR